MDNIGQVIVVLSYLASATMAASAALQATRHNLDPFGATVLACVTALGGGTIRDLMLGQTPVFWIEDSSIFWAIVPFALVTYFCSPIFGSGSGQRYRGLMRLDAIGLALFTLVGVRVALDAQTGWFIAIVLGCVTGTAGGMIRDMLCNVTPSLLKEDLYATISLLGGATYLLLNSFLSDELALGLSFTAMALARLLTIWRRD